MDPTRPTGTKSIREPGRSPIGGIAPVSDAVRSRAEGRQDGDEVADSVGSLERAQTAIRAETARVDASRKDAIISEVRAGTYELDPKGLADRIVEDARFVAQEGDS